MRTEYFVPEIGETYTLRNGGEYRCLAADNAEFAPVGDHVATLVRKDGYRLDAHGVQRNEDGTIEWNYSTGGRWASENVKGDGKVFEVWQDSELGQTYKVKTCGSREEASDWIAQNEKCYPGWHLRIAELG